MTKPIANEETTSQPNYSAPNNSTVGADRTSAVVELLLLSIRPSPLNPRKHFDETAIENLVASIRMFGVEQAITVRPFEATGEEANNYPECKYEIVMGERRWRAACGAELETIPARIVECSDANLVARALIENLDREDLSCIEIAHGYKALADKGWKQDDIATKFRTDQPQVSLVLNLLRLPEYVQGLLQSQRLKKAHGFALLPLADEEKACSWLAKCALDEPLSEKELRERVRSKKAEIDEKKAQPRLPGVETATTTTTKTTKTEPSAPPKPAPEVKENYTPADAKREFEESQNPDPDVPRLADLPAPPAEGSNLQQATGAAAPIIPALPVAPVWTPPKDRKPVTGLLYDDQQEWLVGAGFSLFTGLDRLRQLNITSDAWVLLQMLTHHHNSQPKRLGKPPLSTADVLDIVIQASAVAKELIPSQALATESGEGSNLRSHETTDIEETTNE